jgi:predicted metal-dependent hydrolase
MPITIDRLVRSRRKTISLIVEKDGTLTIRAPLRMAEARIHDFMETHADWIVKHQAKARAARPFLHRYESGEEFLFLGQPYPLRIVSHQRSKLDFNGREFTLAISALPKAKEAFSAWYKEQARSLLTVRVAAQAQVHGFKYKRIRISSARTRWGSCSTTGTLSFTYRLIMAPQEVVDYVVLHELIHTKVKNHSRNFWNNVARLMPDYKRRYIWLKKNGQQLSL